MSGFTIVHRYAYVLLPLEGEPTIVFPAEARYVGEHGDSWIEEQVFADRPGEWLADRLRGKRVGVYGLDYVMTVRDHAALAASTDLVPWDVQFDHARAVKSEAELESVRDSVRINTDGFHAFRDAYAPGQDRRRGDGARREALRRARLRAADHEHGAGRRRVRARAQRHRRSATSASPRSRSPGPAATGSRSRARSARRPPRCARMLEAYEEYYEAAKEALRPGATAHDVHRAVSKGFTDRGYHLGHVTGHSIGMTMIEFPKIGEGVETELAENMVFSMHPHAIAEDGRECLYMQDTWLVTADGGEPLAGLELKIY